MNRSVYSDMQRIWDLYSPKACINLIVCGSIYSMMTKIFKDTFSDLMLERYFKRILIEKQAYTRIGGWWDRKGENEIEFIAENELDNEATFFEVKRKAENIDTEILKEKAAAFLRATGEFKGYAISYKGLSMEDM